MSPDDKYIRRGKIIISIAFIFLITAIGLFAVKNLDYSKSEEFVLEYETIDIKTMGVAKVSSKKVSKNNIFTNIVSVLEKNSKLKEVSLTENKEKVTANQPTIETKTAITPVSLPSKPTWRLPTEQGYITQYAHYNHIALDITSSRGTNERVYPVADGVISSIYHDAYGAKVITVRHYINGRYYTSQYVHLSWFAYGIYAGQKVTTDTILGGMGSTGLSTGVHLHLTVMDCNLYGDANCSDIGRYLNYGRIRVSQGFKGLDSLMHVPHSWYSR